MHLCVSVQLIAKKNFFACRVPCGTKFLRVLIFAIFAVFFAIRKKKRSRKIKLPQFFFRKNLLHCRNYIQKYWFEGEDAKDDSSYR